MALFACAGPVRQAEPHSRHGSEIAVQAMSMIGQPYVWGGSNPQQGFDCSGLVHFVYKQALGLKLPRTAREMSGTGFSVGRSYLQPGDLVFFNTGRRFSHVGIYVGEGRFVHSPRAGKTIRIARLDNRYWKRRYNGARRPDHQRARLAGKFSN
jgi:cell wall-associated NlpC family hydrolase